MTLPAQFTNVPYFNNAYRGDLVVTTGVLYYFPWVNVELEQKQQNSGQLDRLAPLDIPIELGRMAIKSYVESHTPPKLKLLGLWQDGQTENDLRTRLDTYMVQLRTQPPKLLDYEYGLPSPMRFPADELKNMSLRGNLTFDSAFDDHDFEISSFDRANLLQALKEAGFTVSE